MTQEEIVVEETNFPQEVLKRKDILEKVFGSVTKGFPSIQSSVVMFVMSIVLGSSNQLLPPQILKWMNNPTRITQIILTYLLILFTLTLFSDNEKSLYNAFLYAMIVLLIFIVISKQTDFFFFMTMGLLLIIFFFKKHRDLIRANDKKDNQKEEDKINYITNILTIITTLVICIGVTVYFIKQYKSHRKSDSSLGEFLLKFWLGGQGGIFN